LTGRRGRREPEWTRIGVLQPPSGSSGSCQHRQVMPPAAPPSRRRRALCAALPLLAAGPLRAAERLPQRNLVAELRLVDQATMTDGAAVGGSVSVDSRGNVRGGVAVGTLGSTQRVGQGVQAVRVLNGGQARMQIVQTQALVGAVAAWTGYRHGAPGLPPHGAPAMNRPPAPPAGGLPPGSRPGAGGAVVTAWAELIDGFDIRPRWPGGQAPVTVEVGATRSVGPAAGNAPPPRFEVFTTVLAPLGEWTELAQVQRGSRATVSSGGGTSGTQHAMQLQLRVSLAD
jgi:hypothetical protein